MASQCEAAVSPVLHLLVSCTPPNQAQHTCAVLVAALSRASSTGVTVAVLEALEQCWKLGLSPHGAGSPGDTAGGGARRTQGGVGKGPDGGEAAPLTEILDNTDDAMEGGRQGRGMQPDPKGDETGPAAEPYGDAGAGRRDRVDHVGIRPSGDPGRPELPLHTVAAICTLAGGSHPALIRRAALRALLACVQNPSWAPCVDLRDVAAAGVAAQDRLTDVDTGAAAAAAALLGAVAAPVGLMATSGIGTSVVQEEPGWVAQVSPA